MQVTFFQFSHKPFEFDLENSEKSAKFIGSIKPYRGDLALLDARLAGAKICKCDICGEEFQLDFDEEIKLAISSGLFDDSKNDNREELAVIEVDNDRVDLLSIMQGELDVIACDYHYCDKCN